MSKDNKIVLAHSMYVWGHDMNDILAVPEKNLEKQHKTLMRRINTIIFSKDHPYDEIVRLIQRECNRFSKDSMAWPVILRRKNESIEIQIKVVDALATSNGSRYKQSMQYYGRPPSVVAHKRTIDGDLSEVADQTLAVIRFTKTVADVLTTLEQTKCSKDDSNT